MRSNNSRDFSWMRLTFSSFFAFWLNLFSFIKPQMPFCWISKNISKDHQLLHCRTLTSIIPITDHYTVFSLVCHILCEAQIELSSLGSENKAAHAAKRNALSSLSLSPWGRDEIMWEPCMNAHLTLNLFMMFLWKCLEINHFFSWEPLAPVSSHFSGVFQQSSRKSQRKRQKKREKGQGRENKRTDCPLRLN